MKLLIDTNAKRVLFAEADKKVIDFLFSLMVLPVGSIVELVNKKNIGGCIGNLYESIENISDAYIQPNLDKNFLLKPKSVLSTGNIPLLPPSVTETVTKEAEVKYYNCTYTYNSNCRNYVTTAYGTGCPGCARQMTHAITHVGSNTATPNKIIRKGEGGYVKELVTYMVSDDLLVMPMSTISTITLLNKLNVHNFDSLEEKVVKFGVEEGLDLVKACLQTKTALTKVFLVETM